MSTLQLVFHVVETALFYFQCTNRNYIGIIPGDWKRKTPSVVKDASLLPDFRRVMSDLRKVGSKSLNIFLRESDRHSTFLPAGLHGSPPRYHNHKLGPKVREDVRAGLAEAITISKQHDNGGNPPSHPQQL